MDLTNSLTKLQKLYFIMTTVIICALSIHLQQSTILTWDVAWMLHAASSILQGGTYTKNYFEIAPPTDLLLYTPAIFISKLFSITIVSSVRTYIYLIGSISLLTCYVLIKKLFDRDDIKLALAFYICLAATYFVLPVYDFGQKEHLFFIFTMPYILLMAYRMVNSQISFRFAVWVGFLAGLGVAIKPWFLLYPILLELYYLCACKHIYHGKKYLALIRPETSALFFVLLGYTVITIFFFFDYLTVIAPYALRWNYAGMAIPMIVLFEQPIVWISIIACVFYATQPNPVHYKQLQSVMMITVIAALISYFSQRTIFPYHIYPIIVFDCLFFVLLLGPFISISSHNRTRIYYSIGFLSVLLIAVFYKYFRFFVALSILAPNYLYGYVVFVLIFMLFFSNSKKINFLIWPLLIVGGAMIIRYMAFITNSYVFCALMIYFVGMFFLIGKTSKIHVNHFMFSALLVSLFFSLPFLERLHLYHTRLSVDDSFRKLIAFTDQHAPHQSIYFFSTLVEHVPVVDYCKDTTTAMRMPFFWMVPAMVKYRDRSAHYNSDKHYLIEMVTEDIREKKPYLVFVDVSKHKPFLYSFELKEYANFEFIPFFQSEKSFTDEWKKYHYMMTITFRNERKFAVYQRSDL